MLQQKAVYDEIETAQSFNSACYRRKRAKQASTYQMSVSVASPQSVSPKMKRTLKIHPTSRLRKTRTKKQNKKKVTEEEGEKKDTSGCILEK